MFNSRSRRINIFRVSNLLLAFLIKGNFSCFDRYPAFNNISKISIIYFSQVAPILYLSFLGNSSKYL